MAAKQKTGNNQLGMTLLKGRTFFVLILLLIFFSITANNFMSASSLLTVARHVALYGILAIGMTYVIITGGIDRTGADAENVWRDSVFQRSYGGAFDGAFGRGPWGDQWNCYHKVQGGTFYRNSWYNVYLARVCEYPF